VLAAAAVLQASLQASYDMLLRAAIISSLAAMLLALWLARRIAQPLQELTDRAARIATGDYGQKVYLSGSDEVGTLARLRTHRAELLDPAIEMHRGYIANTAGDSILAEFGSVVDAVTCAIEIQRGMLERNGERLRLSSPGVLLSNEIFQEFVNA